jgi:CDP-4-dehydro-6-deoxyglucose reductase, E1
MAKIKNNYIRIPYAMTIHGEEEIEAVNRVLRSSTQMGVNTKKFESEIATLFGHKYGVGTNSGSSSLLLAMESFNLPPGSEVITPVLTFATTIGCIVKNNLIPVFIDSETCNKFIINVDKIEEMITPRTKAMCIPNLMGNMPNWEKLRALADKYELLILEDSADILGGKYNNKPTGYFSDISITSFYGMHMINCAGNGGMITTNNKKFYDECMLLRSWGRSSSLFTDSESIEKRFDVHLDDIRYDAKFIFEKVGYMMEPSELGSAFGLEQLKKLDKTLKKRDFAAKSHIKFFSKYEEWFHLPEMDKNCSSYWFAFPLILKPEAPFTRTDMQIFLEKKNIQTRVIFTGNALRQPAFKNIKKIETKEGYPVADDVMKNGILLASHHGLNEEMYNHLYKSLLEFFNKF